MFSYIITVLAMLVVGGITLVAYLWYLTPSPSDHTSSGKNPCVNVRNAIADDFGGLSEEG